MKNWKMGEVEWTPPYRVTWYDAPPVKAETEGEAVRLTRHFLNMEGVETEGLHIIVEEISK